MSSYQDSNWITANSDQLRAEYAGMWIAIKNQQVIASSVSFAALQIRVVMLGVGGWSLTRIPAIGEPWFDEYEQPTPPPQSPG